VDISAERNELVALPLNRDPAIAEALA